MKITSRYVFKEHVGPFLFALSALTSFMLLQFIAHKFGDLVGRGLSWQVIAEFFVLSLPLTVALTLPMSVLVAVLYAFSRMASENEITALKASGVSTRSLIRPVLAASVVLAFFMLWFNDQVLSSANHELATLQLAILRTKPSFALKEQVINPIKEGQLYLRAGYIDRDQAGRMRDITIYDVNDATRRRTIFADHGTLAFASNRTDLILHLYDGMMISAPSNQPDQLDRIYYKQDELRVKDVANSFQTIDADTASKGDREMSVCEMQKEYESRNVALQNARADSAMAVWRVMRDRGDKRPEPKRQPVHKLGGIGALYCGFVTKYLHVTNPMTVRSVEAAEPSAFLARAVQDTTPKRDTVRRDTTRRDTTRGDTTRQDTTKHPAAASPLVSSDSVWVRVNGLFKKVPHDKIPAGATLVQGATQNPSGGAAALPPVISPPAVATPNPAAARRLTPPPSSGVSNAAADLKAVIANEVLEPKIRIDNARHWRNRYAIEIQKKFSLAAACIVLVLVGAPVALRFPRGGVGLVLIASFLIFSVYYVGLTAGEALANHDLMSPFWSMWAGNIIFAIIGVALVARMGHEHATTRGGNLGELVDSFRYWLEQRRTARAR